jgi:hypothetical protein
MISNDLVRRTMTACALYNRLLPKLFKAGGWLCVLLLCQAGGASFGQQFQAEGTVYFKAFDLNPPLETSFNFDISVSNRVWDMTMTFSDATRAYFRKLSSKTGRPFDLQDYNRYSFDGTNLYVLMDCEAASGRAIVKHKAPAGSNLATGVAVGMEVPRIDLGMNGADCAAWLAYASSCYFQKATNNLLEVPWIYGFPHGTPDPGVSIQRHASWDLGRSAPYLPTSATYFLGDSRNFTNAQYTVHRYTTFQNQILPEESELDLYQGDLRNASSTKMVLAQRYIIKAASFKRLGDMPSFPPAVPVETQVIDWRFNSATDPLPNVPVPYPVNERFLSKEEAAQLPEYREFKLNQLAANCPSAPLKPAAYAKALAVSGAGKLPMPPVHSPSMSETKKTILLSLLTISAVFVLTVVIRKMRSARKTND